MPVDLSLAWRLGRGRGLRPWLLVLCAAVGVAARVAVGTLVGALERAVTERARGLLAADLEISGVRPLEAARRATLAGLLPPGSRTQRQETLTTMARAGARVRPVQLHAVDPGYPFFGELATREQGPGTIGAGPLAGEEPAVLVHPELLVQLGIQVGGRLRLGGLELVVEGVLDRQPGVGAGFLAVGPVVLLRRRDLERTGLVTLGSRVRHAVLVALPDPAAAEAVVERLQQAWGLDPEAPDATSSLRLVTTRDAERRVRGILDRFTDFLRLVSLAAMVLGGLGLASMTRVRVQEALPDGAVLAVLGAGPTRLLRLLGAQVLALASLGAGLGVLLGSALGNLALVVAGRQLSGFELSPGLDPAAMAWGGTLGILVAAGMALPALLALRERRPLEVLRDQPAASGAPGRSLRLLLVGGLGLWLVASLEVRSPWRGAWFAGALVAAALALRVMGAGVLGALVRLGRHPRPPFWVRLGLTNLARPGLRPEAALVTLGLTGLVFAVVGLTQASLLAELEPALRGDRAGLFLVDLQPDQEASLRELVAARGIEGVEVSPMVRARLVALDGAPLARGEGLTREASRRLAFQRREQHLGVRARLGPDEALVEGRWMPVAAGPEAPVEVSLEQRFAARIGVGLGARLTLDVQGVPLEARVTSLRRVRWTSFRPNFFMLVSPHALEGAPAVLVASVPVLPAARKAELLEALVERLPNVTAVDVERQLARVREVLGGVVQAVRVMGLACLAAGVLVLLGMGLASGAARRRDAALLRVLGARAATLEGAVLVEFAALGMAAGGLGVGLALPLTAALLRSFMDLDLVVQGAPLGAVVLLLGVLGAAAGWAACRGATRVEPLRVLRQE